MPQCSNWVRFYVHTASRGKAKRQQVDPFPTLYCSDIVLVFPDDTTADTEEWSTYLTPRGNALIQIPNLSIFLCSSSTGCGRGSRGRAVATSGRTASLGRRWLAPIATRAGSHSYRGTTTGTATSLGFSGTAANGFTSWIWCSAGGGSAAWRSPSRYGCRRTRSSTRDRRTGRPTEWSGYSPRGTPSTGGRTRSRRPSASTTAGAARRTCTYWPVRVYCTGYSSG